MSVAFYSKNFFVNKFITCIFVYSILKIKKMKNNFVRNCFYFNFFLNYSSQVYMIRGEKNGFKN